MATSIIAIRHDRRIIYRAGPCFFTTFKAAVEALQAMQSHRLDLAEALAAIRPSEPVAALTSPR